MGKREGCFWCKFLANDLMVCQLDRDKNINLLLIMDEKPEWCPLEKEEEEED